MRMTRQMALLQQWLDARLPGQERCLKSQWELKKKWLRKETEGGSQNHTPMPRQWRAPRRGQCAGASILEDHDGASTGARDIVWCAHRGERDEKCRPHAVRAPWIAKQPMAQELRWDHGDSGRKTRPRPPRRQKAKEVNIPMQQRIRRARGVKSDWEGLFISEWSILTNRR